MFSSPNRLVAMLTPIVFAPLAGSIAVLAARYFPGVNIDQDALQAIFIAGATIAFGKAALWLKGWQDYEKREAEAGGNEPDLLMAEDDAPAVAAEGGFEDDAFADEEDPVLADEDFEFHANGFGDVMIPAGDE
jgi:hypothetical protein